MCACIHSQIARILKQFTLDHNNNNITTSATTMNKPTSTTESLGKDIDHFTTRDQTRLVSEKKDVIDVAVVNKDYNLKLHLAISLSATFLTLFLILAVAMFVQEGLFYTCIREAKESKSAEVELTKMEELN